MNTLQQLYCVSFPFNVPPTSLAWIATSQTPMVVFGDHTAIHAYSADGNPAWQIKARAGIRGWVFHEFDVYVQDGNVLCQYDTSAFQSEDPPPETALGFPEPGTFGNVKAWRAAVDGPAALGQLYHETPASPAAFSAPLLLDSAAGHLLLWTLRSDGLVYRSHLNLSKATLHADRTSFTPDELTLYHDGNKALFLSGGAVVDLAANQKIPLPGDLDTWKLHHQQWNGLPWRSLGSTGFALLIGDGAAKDAGFAVTVDGESSFHRMVFSPCSPPDGYRWTLRCRFR